MESHKVKIKSEEWDSSSSVRNKPNRYAIPPNWQHELKDKDWFPRKMLPYLDQPCLKNIPNSKIQRLLAQHLIYFLDYTTVLEHVIVNRSLEVIIHNKLNVSMPDQMRTSGLQIYTDEGYHALFSNELSKEAAKIYKIKRWQSTPFRIASLESLIHSTPERFINELYFVIGFVSETIIAKEIGKLTEKTLLAPVHAMFQDHLEDEAKHALFFADLFKTIWHQSTPQQKHFFAKILPSILKIFSSGDSYWLIKALIEAGISLAAAETINDLLNNETSTNKRVSSGASMTFSVLRKVNFFSEPTYASLFLQAGLPYE